MGKKRECKLHLIEHLSINYPKLGYRPSEIIEDIREDTISASAPPFITIKGCTTSQKTYEKLRENLSSIQNYVDTQIKDTKYPHCDVYLDMETGFNYGFIIGLTFSKHLIHRCGGSLAIA